MAYAEQITKDESVSVLEQDQNADQWNKVQHRFGMRGANQKDTLERQPIYETLGPSQGWPQALERAHLRQGAAFAGRYLNEKMHPVAELVKLF